MYESIPGKIYKGKISIFGDVASPEFIPWIKRYGHKIGVSILDHYTSNQCLIVMVEGPWEMLNCLSLGCSLGPKTVLVEYVDKKLSPCDIG